LYLDTEAIMNGFRNPIADAERGVLACSDEDDVLQVAGLQKLQDVREHGLVAEREQCLGHVFGYQRVQLLR